MGRTVLLVDDDEDIRVIAGLALGRVGGWEVVCCASGGEALGRAAHLQPDVVVLDVMMPELDGPSTLARLRAVSGWEQVPVVFLTARTKLSDLEELLALGAAHVITKPFDPMALSGELEQVVAREREASRERRW